MSDSSRLRYFPINLFGATMGFAGLTLSLQKAHETLFLPEYFYLISAFVTALIFISISITYLIKLIKFPASVIDEYNHPIALNFFPTFSISLILMSLVFKDLAYDAAQLLWITGAVVHLFLLISILSSWIHHEKWQIIDMSPAWFIPVVGTIVIPIGSIHYANMELGWFFFSIGLIFWFVLNSIVMYRLFFHPPMLKILEPTLFILIAPPAVGFISYMSLNGMAGVDEFARILYYVGLFMTVLLLSQINRFAGVPFALSWWAYTFPLAAITLASFIMYEQLDLAFYKYTAIFLLVILFSLMVHLTAKTLWAIKTKKLCVAPQPPKVVPIQTSTVGTEPSEAVTNPDTSGSENNSIPSNFSNPKSPKISEK